MQYVPGTHSHAHTHTRVCRARWCASVRASVSNRRLPPRTVRHSNTAHNSPLCWLVCDATTTQHQNRPSTRSCASVPMQRTPELKLFWRPARTNQYEYKTLCASTASLSSNFPDALSLWLSAHCRRSIDGGRVRFSDAAAMPLAAP